MDTHHDIAGFSLVELAVVVLVVGLLVAAGLGFQQIRTHALLTKTIIQTKEYGAGAAIFLDRYGAMPGDLRDAARKVPGCGLGGGTCEALPTAATTGDGMVGSRGEITRHQTAGGVPAEDETSLFWAHLLLTELIRGVTDTYVTSSSPTLAWGASHPAAAVGGGFHAKHADGGVTSPLPGWPPLAVQPTGTFLVLQRHVAEDLVPAQPGRQVLTAGQASAIDRKIDDGDPFKGTVVGYGTISLIFTNGGCFAWTAIDDGLYDATQTHRDCGLAFRIGP